LELVNYSDRASGKSPLHVAVSNRRLNLVKTLLKNGANINSQDKGGNTPLHFALRDGTDNLEMIRILLASKVEANLNIVNDFNENAFHLLCKLGDKYYKFVQKCLERVNDLNVQTIDGRTALHEAADLVKGNETICTLLISDLRTNISLKDRDGNTPLHLSVKRGSVIVVNMMLGAIKKRSKQHGELYDFKEKNNDGLTVLELSQKMGHLTITNLIKSAQKVIF